MGELKTLTKHEKMNMSTVDIAKEVKKQLKKEFPGCKWSVRSEYFSMGSSLSLSLMQADRKTIKDGEEITEINMLHLGSGYTIEDIRGRQSEGYHQLNPFVSYKEYDSEYWNNGVFLTEEGHNLLKRAVRIVNQYNWDDSEPETDYFDVHFYFHLEIGKHDKPFNSEII